MLCNMCPRKCNVDRANALGFCHESIKVRIAKIIPNFMFEEPCISGKKGALAIFFSGCNLRCEFCQNYEISHLGKGKEYTKAELVKLLKTYNYQQFSCVDLITPSQFSAQIADALAEVNIPIPVVWNSNGYETKETISLVAPYVDVFLVDFKFYDDNISLKLCGAKDYFSVASEVVKLMTALKPNVFDGELLTSGVLLRHLILPDHAKDSIKVLEFISKNIENPLVSIMAQFTPIEGSILTRKITPLEYKLVLTAAQKLNLNHGYYQSLDSADKDFIPDF